MIKKFKKAVVAVVMFAMLATMTTNVSAAPKNGQKTKYIDTRSGYYYVNMKTYTAKVHSKRVDAPGFHKTKYTTGSITVKKTKSYEFSTSAKIEGEYKTLFCKVGGYLQVSAKVSDTVSAGVKIKVEKNAPNGIYYGILCVPQKKTDFIVKSCSHSYTEWRDKYKKTFKYAPCKVDEYLDVERD